MIRLSGSSLLGRIWRWGMNILKDVYEFIQAVSKQWLFLLGIVPILLTYFFPKLKKYISDRILKIIAVICLFIAIFLAWQDEHEKWKDEHDKRTKIELQLTLVKHKEEIRFQIAKFIEEGNKLKKSCETETERVDLKLLYEDWAKRVVKYLSFIDPSYIPIFDGAIGQRYGGIGPRVNEDIWNLVNIRNKVLEKIMEEQKRSN